MNYIRQLNAFYSCVKTDKRLTSSHVSLYLALFQYWNYNRFQNAFPVYRDRILQLCKIGSKNTYHKCLKELHSAGYIYRHAAISKFDPVRISMAVLGNHNDNNDPLQLDIFTAPHHHQHGQVTQQTDYVDQRNPQAINLSITDINQRNLCTSNPAICDNSCPQIDTLPVPNLTLTSPKFDTGTKANMGHSIKQNLCKTVNSVCTHTQIFEKNENISNALKGFASFPSPTHTKAKLNTRPLESRVPTPPELGEVETFFSECNYAVAEAQKFFYYNNGKAWQLNSKMAISNWQSLAHKWMLNESTKSINKRNPNYHNTEKKDYSLPL